MKPTIYKLYLALITFEGVLALVFVLSTPWAGSTRSRLAVSLILLVVTLLFAGVTAWALLDRGGLDRLVGWVDRQMEFGNRLLALTISLIFGCLLMCTLLILWQSPLIYSYRWYASIFKNSLHLYEVLLVVINRLSLLFVWLTAIVFQSLLVLLVIYADRYRQRGFWNKQAISRTALVLAMVIFSVIQWTVLALRLSLHNLLPGWYWSVNLRPFTPRLLLFLVLLGLSLIVVWYVIRHPQRVWLSLLLLVALGYLVQVGVGVIEGGGYEYIRMKYAGSNHRSYALIATGELPDPLQAVRQYEEKYGFKMFPSTKPPGVVLIYIVIERFVNQIQPGQTQDARFLTLTSLLAYIFPLVSFLVIGIIYLFMRPLVRADVAIIPSILYIFIPNVILIPMFLDQVLYPMLFIIGVFLMWRVVRTRSILLAVLAGIYFYIVIFFTFSLLTLLPFFLILLGLDYLFNRKERSISRSMILVVALGIGVITLFFLMRAGLNYDIFRRYATAMRVVRNFDFVLRTGEKVTTDLSTVTVQPSFRQILRASFLNNLEFAAAVGFPAFFLFLWRVVRTLLAFIRNKVSQLDLALGALCLTYIAMNLYGQMQGEASRIWIFWVPMVVIFAGVELASQFRRKDLALYIVIALQFITILMIFQFQDFIV